MLSFSEFLDEARRNPELNPKIGTLEQLEPYKDRDFMAMVEKTTSPQDPDIKKREGTQPKKYYAKDAEGDEMAKLTRGY